MAEIKFSKVPIIVGASAPSSGIEIGAGVVRMTVQASGEKLELVMPADEAEKMGCGFIVGAHAARTLGQQAAPPLEMKHGRGH